MDVIAKPRNEGSRAARMQPLSSLPVFFDLKGKPVLVAGGSPAAAWKAELMIAAGAEVHLFCPAEHLSAEALGLFRAAGASPPSVGFADISPTRGGSGPVPLAAPNENLSVVEAAAARVPSPPLWGRCPEGTEGGGDITAAANPTLTHHDTPWTDATFKTFALAVGDCATIDEARAFHAAACRAGVPVNVIDRPEFCHFKFGSIVNRSPVVIGISTDGAAPILGQAIRRRIETLLPQALAGWAGLARKLRDTVLARIADGAGRRSFWEGFVDLAFAGDHAPDPGSEARLVAGIDRLRTGLSGATGRVTLVGAGPGDAELLTLKAVRALQAADVILFDDLVSPDVLELARREARRLLVGKRGGRESCRQEDINDMMVRFAKAGKRVVRLKSGDPMIFGRAGEEIARLERENIPVDIVPGITSAMAMAARLGVSLTHRDHAQSVRFVTGHARDGQLPANLDWRALANAAETTVFYMGGRTAPKISAALLAAGMGPHTPAVVMTAISRPEERRWVGALQDLVQAVADLGIDQPILIGIGNAFSAASSRTATAWPAASAKV